MLSGFSCNPKDNLFLPTYLPSFFLSMADAASDGNMMCLISHL
jgi:hypothetical protein